MSSESHSSTSRPLPPRAGEPFSNVYFVAGRGAINMKRYIEREIFQDSDGRRHHMSYAKLSALNRLAIWEEAEPLGL